MCIFCAAIPATVAASASIQHKQRQQNETPGPSAKASPFPIKKVTTVIVAGLVVGSVVTHTHLMGGI